MKLNPLPQRQALAVMEVVAASDEEVDVCCGEGPGNPCVPLQNKATGW
jgi:hypothetical protein